MLSYIARFLPVLLYPVGLSGALVLFAGIAAVFRKTRAAAVLAFLGAGVLWFFSCQPVSWGLTRFLECQFDPAPALPKSPAIVLLGGCTKPAVPPRTRVELACAGDRVLQAARLYKQGRAPLIIATGGKVPFVYDFAGSEGACMAELLTTAFGVDTSAVIVEDKARDTHAHAPTVEAIMVARHMKKEIILVTSAMHMFRSVAVFRKRGFNVHPAPADFVADVRLQWNLYGLLPRGECLFGSTNALHEYYGIVAYKILGWI